MNLGALLAATVVGLCVLTSGTSAQADDPKHVNDPAAVTKAMDGFRKEVPPPVGLNEMNGFVVARNKDGKGYTLTHLAGIAKRLGVKTRAESMVLLTYLKDTDPKLRYIAGFAVEEVVKAYPNGMSANAVQDVDSDEHRAMVKKFIAGIEKLPN